MFVYVLRGGGFINFGISKNLSRRHQALTGGLPFKVELLCYAVLEADVARLLERALLNWAMKHANGEWFFADGRPAEEIAAYIRKILGPDLGQNVHMDTSPERHVVRYDKIAKGYVDIMRKAHLAGHSASIGQEN